MKNHAIHSPQPILSLHLAVMMFGLSGVIGRIVHVSSVTLAGGRVLCSSLVLLAMLLFRKQSLRAVSGKDTMLTCLAGLLLAAHWTSFFQSVRMASVAIGTITYSTFPLFLLVLEPLLYHEKMSLRNTLLSFGLLAGVLITVPEFSFSNHTTVGILFGMLSSVTYALLTLINRRLSRSYSGTWVSFREQSAAAAVLLPVLLVRAEPVTASDILGIAAIGLICCATQGLEVLSLEGDWAQIRAANYNNGQFITGWFPARDLACVSPSPHYAVLVDKREQTLTVWQDGHPIGTVPVSTGLATEAKPERETSPGAFLTDIHFSRDFAQEGARYDYPLRYQGGNIIHSTGYARIPHAAYSVKDYSKNLPLLGQKASHGCVRVSPFTTADCPINSYWLWTHLPYHTRVIILDD